MAVPATSVTPRWTTRLQAPHPPAAAARAAAPPTTLLTTDRVAIARWPNSRSMRAIWVAPATEITRMAPSALRSGATAGSSKSPAIGPASSTRAPATSNDTASEVQNTVSAIAGDTDLARGSAAASPADGRILPNSANATARANSPNASGPSFRARTAKTANERM
jgi:hypothetical protein